MIRIAVATAAAALLAALANVVVRVLAVAAFDIPQPEFEPLEPRAVVVSTVGGVAAGGAAFAAIARLARDPVRVFLWVAAVALVLSLWAPLSLALADPPEHPGTDAASVGTLMAMHVVAAAIAVPALIRAWGRPPGLSRESGSGARPR